MQTLFAYYKAFSTRNGKAHLVRYPEQCYALCGTPTKYNLETPTNEVDDPSICQRCAKKASAITHVRLVAYGAQQIHVLKPATKRKKK